MPHPLLHLIAGRPHLLLEHLEAGDTVHVVETAEGLLITPYDPGFAAALAVYERGARKYRNALHELSK